MLLGRTVKRKYNNFPCNTNIEISSKIKISSRILSDLQQTSHVSSKYEKPFSYLLYLQDKAYLIEIVVQ